MITQWIRTLIRRGLHMRENDQYIDRIHNEASSTIREATLVLERAGKKQEILVRKTTTFYMAKALGVIQ